MKDDGSSPFISFKKEIMKITKEYLQQNPNHIFVFGDNLLKKGKAGDAWLRDEPNTYGFLTKKYPNNNDDSFYHPNEYAKIFSRELAQLEMAIRKTPNCLWLISSLGSGFANKYHIWEEIIQKELNKLEERNNNVRLLF